MKSYNASSWSDPRLEVRNSTIEGNGGFARELIRAGETVVIIGGTPFTDDALKAFIPTVEQYDSIQIGEDLHLIDLSPDPRATNGSLNHSCDSNLWMADEVTLVARRDILPGEEITVDYALFTTLPEWQLDKPCECGSPACRHIITGSDWQRADVQERYKGHFSPFVNERINRL